MSQGQKRVLGVLLFIAVLELGLTSRLTKIWQLAFGPHVNATFTGTGTNSAPTSTTGK